MAFSSITTGLPTKGISHVSIPELIYVFLGWTVFISHEFTSWVSLFELSESEHQIAHKVLIFRSR